MESNIPLHTLDIISDTIYRINYRDTTAQNESSPFEGGSFARVQYISTLARLTKERCYELVNTYMK